MKHSSIAYFLSYFSTLSNAVIFLLNHWIIYFSNIGLKTILIEIGFLKDKAIYLDGKQDRLVTYLMTPYSKLSISHF